jgi:hypothetical protein
MLRSPFALALLLATVLAGCGILPGTEPTPTGPLVILETRGGDCPTGTCGGTVVIERDGWVRDMAPRALERGRIPEDRRRALEEAIRTTDFAALQAKPFDGECPVNFDGQEQIYTFGTAAGPVTLASCEVDIDPAHPLFVAVENAFASLAEL